MSIVVVLDAGQTSVERELFAHRVVVTNTPSPGVTVFSRVVLQVTNGGDELAGTDRSACTQLHHVQIGTLGCVCATKVGADGFIGTFTVHVQDRRFDHLKVVCRTEGPVAVPVGVTGDRRVLVQVACHDGQRTGLIAETDVVDVAARRRIGVGTRLFAQSSVKLNRQAAEGRRVVTDRIAEARRFVGRVTVDRAFKLRAGEVVGGTRHGETGRVDHGHGQEVRRVLTAERKRAVIAADADQSFTVKESVVGGHGAGVDEDRAFELVEDFGAVAEQFAAHEAEVRAFSKAARNTDVGFVSVVVDLHAGVDRTVYGNRACKNAAGSTQQQGSKQSGLIHAHGFSPF